MGTDPQPRRLTGTDANNIRRSPKLGQPLLFDSQKERTRYQHLLGLFRPATQSQPEEFLHLGRRAVVIIASSGFYYFETLALVYFYEVRAKDVCLPSRIVSNGPETPCKHHIPHALLNGQRRPLKVMLSSSRSGPQL